MVIGTAAAAMVICMVSFHVIGTAATAMVICMVILYFIGKAAAAIVIYMVRFPFICHSRPIFCILKQILNIFKPSSFCAYLHMIFI